MLRRPWTGRTCSSSSSTVIGVGTATTTSSETSCTRTCSKNDPLTFQTCIVERPAGRRSRANRGRSPACAGWRRRERAADLVELNYRALGRDRREDLFAPVGLTICPMKSYGDRPVLAIALIGGLMASNDFDDVGLRLNQVEQLLLAKPTADLVVVDRDELLRQCPRPSCRCTGRHSRSSAATRPVQLSGPGRPSRQQSPVTTRSQVPHQRYPVWRPGPQETLPRPTPATPQPSRL